MVTGTLSIRYATFMQHMGSDSLVRRNRKMRNIAPERHKFSPAVAEKGQNSGENDASGPSRHGCRIAKEKQRLIASSPSNPRPGHRPGAGSLAARCAGSSPAASVRRIAATPRLIDPAKSRSGPGMGRPQNAFAGSIRGALLNSSPKGSSSASGAGASRTVARRMSRRSFQSNWPPLWNTARLSQITMSPGA